MLTKKKDEKNYSSQKARNKIQSLTTRDLEPARQHLITHLTRVLSREEKERRYECEYCDEPARAAVDGMTSGGPSSAERGLRWWEDASCPKNTVQARNVEVLARLP